MAYGNLLYVTVGYTQSDNASLRKGYPIKQRYKQTSDVASPQFPEHYTLISNEMYWLPFLDVATNEANYIEYEAGDEYGWSDDQAKRAPQIPYSNPRTTKYDDYPINQKIVYANTIYVATRFTFDWGLSGLPLSENPYKSSTIRKWRKFTDTSDTWVQHWYHPLLKKFFVLANIDAITELPDFDEPTQSRWDRFIGDAKDMNLDNFSFAQIKELISQGSSSSAASALVASLDERSMAIGGATAGRATQTAQVRTGTTQGAVGSFTVNSQGSAQIGTSTSAPDNLPKMIQRTASATSSQKVVLDTYIFNLRPNNIQYTNIGITWTEVDRVNNFPLVDYRNNKLMKISFEFVVESYTQNISSLYEDCESRLHQLQRMANRPELVVFTNFDSLFDEAAIFTPLEANYREWAIVEMSINSVQRTPQGSNVEVGRISRATVSMTIQEVRLTKDQVIFMPKLRKVPKVPTTPTPGGDPTPCINYATDSAPNNLGHIPNSACFHENAQG
jgi:hypothetical protein